MKQKPKSVYKKIGMEHEQVTGMISKNGKHINKKFNVFRKPLDAADYKSEVKSLTKHDNLMMKNMHKNMQRE